MTIRPVKHAAFVLAILSAAILAGVQLRAGSTPQKSGTERLGVGGLTLQQALAKPDATKLVLADGTAITVGDLRKRAQARDRLIATRGRGPFTGGSAKLSFPGGLAKAKAVVALAQQESAAAKAMWTIRSPNISGVNAGKVADKAILKPVEGIKTVNGKTRGFIFSPGGSVTIKGGAFGDTLGEVNLFGKFAGAAVAFRVVDWRPDEIYAIFPDGLRGVPDHDVTLQVITRAGKTYKIDGGKFYASREDVVMTTNIPRMVRLTAAGAWPATMYDGGEVMRFQWFENKTSFFCGGGGLADRLTALDPGRGFVVTILVAHWGRTDSGDKAEDGLPGARLFWPGYGFGDWEGDSIDVRWGVWQDHELPYGPAPVFDFCESRYKIEVTLSGPAGIAPF